MSCDEHVVSRAAHYGRVPVTLLFAEGVKSEEIHLYAYLTTFDCAMSGEAWPGRALAAEELGWSVRTLDRWLAALEERNAIRRTQCGAQAALIELLADTYNELPDMAGLPQRVARLATSRKRTSYRTTKNDVDPKKKIEPKPVCPQHGASAGCSFGVGSGWIHDARAVA